MVEGYRPKGNATSEGLIPPHTKSNITKPEADEKKIIELEEALIEKDKEIAYLKGKIDAMQDIIKELNAPIEITQER